MEQEQMIELVKRSQSGDQAAFSELLQAAHTSISYQCRKLLKREQDAEDVTQEVMITLYQKLDTLQEPAAFWGWLNRITANRCKNALTRTHVDLQIAEDEDGHSMLDDIENTDQQLVPDAAIDNAETTRMIEEIVDSLPEAQKMCTLLFYYDEMSVKEIAEVMGTSENTVKSRLNYARKAMKESVLDYEKKQGVRLHGLSPIPFLLYFLRKASENSADPAAAQAMAAQVMTQGAAMAGTTAISGEAANGTFASETIGNTASAAGNAAASSSSRTAFSHILSGISLKTAAGAIAGLLVIGGAAAGISAAVNNNLSSMTENLAAASENEPAAQSEEKNPVEENSEEEVIPMTESFAEESSPLLDEAVLSKLPYTGDVAVCTMTAEQAEAYAQIIDDCILKSQNRTLWDGVTWFCRAALFDAGDGVPALMIAGGVDMCYPDDRESGYMPDFSRIYCWDGTQAVLAVDDTANFILTEKGLLLDYFGAEEFNDSNTPYTEMYSLSKGMVSSEPVHVYEQFAFDTPEAPTSKMVEERVAQGGHFRGTYDYGTLGADTWLYHDDFFETGGVLYEEPGWVAACLDGKFLSVNAAAEEGNMLIWGAVDWLLGHGPAGSMDVSHYWYGDWSDAQDVIDLLHGDSAAEETSDNYGELTASTLSSGYPGASILHTALNTQEDLEIYYEIPVFEGQGEGYDKINAFFQELNDDFWGPENEDLAWMLETVSEYPPNDTYRDKVTARICDWTDQYISVSLAYSWYMGGVKDFGNTNYNFRTDTGEELLLSDISDCSDTEIKDMILDAMIQTYGDIDTYFPGSSDIIRNYNIEDFDFYISDGHVYVCFDKYEIAYGAAGDFEVELPIMLSKRLD